MALIKEQYSFLEQSDENPDNSSKPVKDSQRNTPRNKKKALTHGEKAGKGLTKTEVERAKQEAAGQLGFDFFRSVESYTQLQLPNLLHRVGRLVTSLRDQVGFKDTQRMIRRQAAGAA